MRENFAAIALYYLVAFTERATRASSVYVNRDGPDSFVPKVPMVNQ
jgi:hypothetical protein